MWPQKKSKTTQTDRKATHDAAHLEVDVDMFLKAETATEIVT